MKVREIMKADVTTVDEGDDVALALQIMLWTGIRHLPVLRAGELAGVISERDILAGRLGDTDFYGHTRQKVGELMSSPARSVQPEAGLADAAGAMAVHKIGCLPVLDGNRLVGIVTATDILAANAQQAIPRPPAAERRVRNVMTHHVYTAHEDDHILDAVARMTQYGTRHLPVVDADGRLVGILSDRDVRTAVGNPLRSFEEAAPAAHLESMRVRHAMTADPRTVHPDDPLTNALVALLHGRFSAVPVIDDEEHIAGIVSYVDLLRFVAPQLTGTHAA